MNLTSFLRQNMDRLKRSLKHFAPAAATGFLAFSLQPSAFSQVTPTTVFVLTNLPSSIAAGATATLFPAGTTPTTNVISLRQGQGVAVFQGFAGSGANNTNTYAVNWAVSVDGTNYTTAGLLQSQCGQNGTNQVWYYTNFTSALLNNALFLAPCSIVNNTTNSGCAVANPVIEISFGNIVPGGYQ